MAKKVATIVYMRPASKERIKKFAEKEGITISEAILRLMNAGTKKLSDEVGYTI